MAWNRGDLITAQALNAENASKVIHAISFDASWNDQTHWSEWYYIHHATGVFARIYANNTAFLWPRRVGWLQFRDAAGNIQEWVLFNNTNRNGSDDVYMDTQYYRGAGWYRLGIRANRGYGNGYIWPYQRNCWVGGKLCWWDYPTNSGNRINIGGLITADALNSGQIGVY